MYNDRDNNKYCMKNWKHFAIIITIIEFMAVYAACEQPDMNSTSEPQPQIIEIFTVTFNANGGTPEPQSQDVEDGGKVTEPPAMTKTNCSFDGWYREDAFSNKWDFAEDAVTADITLYAKWEPYPVNQHSKETVKFDKDYDVFIEGTFTDIEWPNIVTRVKNALAAAYETGAYGNGIRFSTVFGDGVTIVVEENPIGYPNFKIDGETFRKLYLNVNSIESADYIYALLAMYSNINVSCDSDSYVYHYNIPQNNFEVEGIHVFLIGLDGWGSYSFANNDFNMPTINELMDNGCYTLKALDVMPSISLPNWSSMFMGTSPDITGYKTNDPSEAHSKIVDTYGLFPSIFTLLKEQRPECKTAFFYEWEENGFLCPDNVIDKKQYINNLSKDISTVTNYIETEHPNFCAIIFAEPDETGHSFGFNSHAYYEQLSKLDELIGQIIQTIKDSGIWDNSIIIFSSDHGGKNTGHGGNTPLEREIPIIFFGNNIKEGMTIVQDVMIYDIAATMAYIYKLETPLFWEGKKIDVFQK